MLKWAPEEIGNCPLTDKDVAITFVASSFGDLGPQTQQKRFVSNGSFHPDSGQPVSVCSQYLWWLSGLFTPEHQTPKTLADIEIREDRSVQPPHLYLFLAPKRLESPEESKDGPEAPVLNVEGMHEGNALDLENAARQMAQVQAQIDELNRNFQHVEKLTVFGLYGDALLVLSPVGGQPNTTGKQLLRKTEHIVFRPPTLKPGKKIVRDAIEPWECGKIDKFLADNPNLTICFQDQQFELPDGGKVNLWELRPASEEESFKLEHRRRVTVKNSQFVKTTKNGSVVTDLSVDPARQLALFGRVVP